jgi:hypothetical protein
MSLRRVRYRTKIFWTPDIEDRGVRLFVIPPDCLFNHVMTVIPPDCLFNHVMTVIPPDCLFNHVMIVCYRFGESSFQFSRLISGVTSAFNSNFEHSQVHNSSW